MCPICKIGKKTDLVQTKEHVFGGQCLATEWAVNHAKQTTQDLLVAWDLQNSTVGRISYCIEKELSQVNTQEHSLVNHGLGVSLIGLWTNRTIIDIKNAIKEDLHVQDHKALLMVFQLIFIHLEVAANIHTFLNRWKNLWITDISPDEASWTTGGSLHGLVHLTTQMAAATTIVMVLCCTLRLGGGCG